MYGNANDILFFCDQMRKARESAGLSQEDLAERLDVSYMTIHRFETGKRMPSIDIIFRFMEATNASFFSLIPSHFIDQSPIALDSEYNKLSNKNKQVVNETTTTLISALLLTQ